MKKFIISMITMTIIVILIVSNIREKNSIETYINNTINEGEYILYEESNYLAVLEIPRIKVKKEIYNFNDKRNDVNVNVQILNGSILPDNDNSIVYLASHSGTGIHTYFNNLNKLFIGDEIKFYYNNKTYIYEVSDYEIIEKNGYLPNIHVPNKCIVLITCYKTKEQLVVIGKLKTIA